MLRIFAKDSNVNLVLCDLENNDHFVTLCPPCLVNFINASRVGEITPYFQALVSLLYHLNHI